LIALKRAGKRKGVTMNIARGGEELHSLILKFLEDLEKGAC